MSPFGQGARFPCLMMSPHSLHLRASLQKLLSLGRGPDLAHMCAQVDMFSYGMVLYELLSGQRPALGQHQLQIAKKLSKGIRPILGQPEEVQFHRLQALMVECWDTKPEKVPGDTELGPGPFREPMDDCLPALPKGPGHIGRPFSAPFFWKVLLLLLVHPHHFLRVCTTRENELSVFFPHVCVTSSRKPSTPALAQPRARAERTSESLFKGMASKFADVKLPARCHFKASCVWKGPGVLG